MRSIDRWVVHAAFETLSRGRSDAPAAPTCFAPSTSPGSRSATTTFLHYVSRSIDRRGVPPRRICFEITETAAVANLATPAPSSADLKNRGCRFALDDFGSGMSSFAYLQDPGRRLPEDRRRVRARTSSPTRCERALVESIHQIGHVMGIRTIAESVENRETLEALREIGVDYAQGYAIAAPVPLDVGAPAAAHRQSRG